MTILMLISPHVVNAMDWHHGLAPWIGTTSSLPSSNTFHGRKPCSKAVSDYVMRLNINNRAHIFVTIHAYSQLRVAPLGIKGARQQQCGIRIIVSPAITELDHEHMNILT